MRRLREPATSAWEIGAPACGRPGLIQVIAYSSCANIRIAESLRRVKSSPRSTKMKTGTGPAVRRPMSMCCGMRGSSRLEELDVARLKAVVPAITWDRLQGGGVKVPEGALTTLEELWDEHLQSLGYPR